MKYIVLLLLLVSTTSFAMEINYLNNPEVLDQTYSLLKEKGMNPESLNTWKDQITAYKQRMDAINSTLSGWVSVDIKQDHTDNSIIYSQNNINCRMNTFILCKDLISLDDLKRKNKNQGYLDREINSLNHFFEQPLTEKEREKYKSLFYSINLPMTDSYKDAVMRTQEYYRLWWKKEGLTFPADPEIKIMQILIIDPVIKIAWMDHTGLIIQKEGYFYLIENQGWQAPFMASRFKNIDELGQYCAHYYEKWAKNMAIMLNDEIVYSEEF